MAGAQFSQSRSYAVPDALFDKSALASVARHCSVSGGASIVELDRDDPIAVLPNDRAAGGILVQTARELAESTVTLLADGAIIPAMIEPLGIRHPLAVYRSPLVAMPGPPGLRAALLVDLDRNLSYVRHQSAARSSASYTIAPSRFGADGDGARPMTDLLTFDAWPSWPRPDGRVVAVAREIEVAEVQGSPPIMPWIHRFESEGFPGLVAAVAGVANLALWTARQVMKLLIGGQSGASCQLALDQEAGVIESDPIV
jgi:hypothetical protein